MAEAVTIHICAISSHWNSTQATNNNIIHYYKVNFPFYKFSWVLFYYIFYKYLLSQLSFLLLYLNRLVVYDSILATIHPPTIILNHHYHHHCVPLVFQQCHSIPKSTLLFFSCRFFFIFQLLFTAPTIATATDALV